MTNTETALNVTTHATTIYTDGSSLSNPGPGGWSAIILRDNSEPQEISGGTNEETTNNRMEMTAAIEALKAVSPIVFRVTIISDSEYVIKGMSQWLQGWKTKGWKSSNKKPVKNQDLWEELDKLNSSLIRWSWVKGHARNEWNERADVVANTAAQKAADLIARQIN
ncbi:ribonuclease HI [Brucella pituitosa]|uniref:ribonuclease HI n=1 Tax=Brucella pituitosa TaxID=571256 RepID=UPI003F4AD590